jgi:hypothetical protein
MFVGARRTGDGGRKPAEIIGGDINPRMNAPPGAMVHFLPQRCSAVTLLRITI